ncbi:MAG: hypothetical protein WDO71_20090 [Bacteroidota bacterium]
MVNLPNGCSCSNLSVYPKNWQSKTAKVSFDWYIMYRFYDPKFQKPKQVMVKGMNQFKILPERQKATKNALSSEMDKLLKDGYNPLIKSQIASDEKAIINPQTPIMEALFSVYEKVEVSARTKKDLKFMLSTVGSAIKSLGLIKYPISQVSRKTIKMILEAASNSPDRFNKNRSYLMILFSEICELELVETNPVRDIKKKKVVKHIRQVLTDEERNLVNEHLKNNYPSFIGFCTYFSTQERGFLNYSG